MFVWQPKKGKVLILKYEKGRVPKKKGRGEHPAISLGRSLVNVYDASASVRMRADNGKCV